MSFLRWRHELNARTDHRHTARTCTFGPAVKITAELQPWKKCSSSKSREAQHGDSGKTQDTKTAPLCQPQTKTCVRWTRSVRGHGNFLQFWRTQPVGLTSNFSRSMTHSSFCAPSMNSDKVIWPVEHKDTIHIHHYVIKMSLLSGAFYLKTHKFLLVTVSGRDT